MYHVRFINISYIHLIILCYFTFVTLLFSPLHQSGKDLSLLLKLSNVGALTTADGKSFIAWFYVPI